MNEMNELETRLRYWAPRRPSARLEQKIFARQEECRETEERKERPPAFSFRWLVPATAALMLVCMVFNQRNSAAVSTSSGHLVAMILSNQSSAAYLPSSFHGPQNLLTADTFEWTNGSSSTSSISSLSAKKGFN